MQLNLVTEVLNPLKTIVLVFLAIIVMCLAQIALWLGEEELCITLDFIALYLIEQ